MTYVVTQHCEKCKYTDCVEACPVDAFHEGDNMLYINPDKCIDCDACVPICPVKAIYKDSDVPERYAHYLDLNRTESENHPVISISKEPMSGALTIEQWEEKDRNKSSP